MSGKMILEACVDSVESAIAAQSGGADRLELCSDLIIGGTTPSLELYREVRKHVTIPIHILIRPRFGDFLYSDYEFNIMCHNVEAFQRAGAEGIVIGMLNPEGKLDLEKMKELIKNAAGMSVTLHRAFDMSFNLMESLQSAIELGITTILTSGGEESASQGLETLRELQMQASGRIQIMAGAGVNADTILKLHKLTGIFTFHMSGKKVLDSKMIYRNERINMGLPGISEYKIWQTSEAEIRSARNIIDQLQ
ncbi:MAG: copper homeostasis protein CutC [Lachnospiraceae bacterium]|nr:copper homeostasis protein CutC [Lachnospiraceae bacterium]MDD3659546.1 copper homeostasis protein CutC [Lachnospiraceae bacterium]